MIKQRISGAAFLLENHKPLEFRKINDDLLLTILKAPMYTRYCTSRGGRRSVMNNTKSDHLIAEVEDSIAEYISIDSLK
jgi:hypothetical protein